MHLYGCVVIHLGRVPLGCYALFPANLPKVAIAFNVCVEGFIIIPICTHPHVDAKVGVKQSLVGHLVTLGANDEGIVQHLLAIYLKETTYRALVVIPGH
jgi:hypothetical protein